MPHRQFWCKLALRQSPTYGAVFFLALSWHLHLCCVCVYGVWSIAWLDLCNIVQIVANTLMH